MQSSCHALISKLGNIFEDGNIPGFFDKFETQHDCDENEFCKSFRIQGIFDKGTLSLSTSGRDEAAH